MNVVQIDLPRTIEALSGLVAAIGVIVIHISGKRREKKQEQAAEETHQELKSIQTLVNGQHSHVLKQNATATRSLAEVTKDPMHVAAAEEAQKLLEDHLAAAERKAQIQKSNESAE